MTKPKGKIAKCKWKQDDDGVYDSSCGHKWQFIEGGPRENGMKFCCYCGKPLVTIRRKP